MNKKTHDLVIIGAGPAGLSAAIYAARYKIDFCIVSQIPGGTVTEAHEVENYPGLDQKLEGHLLGDRMLKQLSWFEHKPEIESIQAIKKEKDSFVLMGNNTEYHAKAVLLAMGMKKMKLGAKGEDEFEGRGVSYCATCDGYFYRDKNVAVVGGGDAAAMAATYLSDIANKVYLIMRKPEFRCDPFWEEKLCKNKKIEILRETAIEEIKGVDKVESILVKGKKDQDIKVEGVFIEIGQTPQTVLTKQANLKCTEKDLICVDAAQKTSVKGIWAAGDITTGSNGFRQIVTAAAEGAVAALDIYTELKKS